MELNRTIKKKKKRKAIFNTNFSGFQNLSQRYFSYNKIFIHCTKITFTIRQQTGDKDPFLSIDIIPAAWSVGITSPNCLHVLTLPRSITGTLGWILLPFWVKYHLLKSFQNLNRNTSEKFTFIWYITTK